MKGGESTGKTVCHLFSPLHSYCPEKAQDEQSFHPTCTVTRDEPAI